MVRSATVVLALALLLPVLPASASAQQTQVRTHTVEEGTTLWSLARTYYGDPYDWVLIFEANRDRLQDPDRLEPGLVLRIPGGTANRSPMADGEPQRSAASADSGAAAVTGGGVVRAVAVQSVRAEAGSGGAAAATSAAPATGERPLRPVRTGFYDEPSATSAVAGGDAAPGGSRLALSEDDLHRARWLVPEGRGPEHDGRVERLGSDVQVHRAARPFDEARVSLEGPAPAPGARLQVFRIGRLLPGLGRVAVPTGTLRVTGGGSEGVVARVDAVYGRMARGDLVRRLPEVDVDPSAELSPAAEPLRATVVGFGESRLLRVVGDHVFLDAGSARGVRIGDVFELEAGGGSDVGAGLAARRASVADRAGVSWATVPGAGVFRAGSRGTDGLRVQVVSVHDGYATARVMSVENPEFETGVVLRLSGRMR